MRNTELYRTILGLTPSWTVVSVDLDVKGQQVVVKVTPVQGSSSVPSVSRGWPGTTRSPGAGSMRRALACLVNGSPMEQDPRIEAVCNTIRPLRERLVTHEVYTCVDTIRDVAIFMEHHVFAVWDFMSLLKSLQQLLTCVSVPWVPRGDRAIRRLISELVLGEESDEVTGSGYVSHFELYRDAMVECGADTAPIDGLIVRLTRGEPVREALRSCGAPVVAQTFVETTWKVVESASPHRLAAAFALGREEIIPDMFRQLVASLQRQFSGRLTTLQTYLERHVHVDEDRHGPLAMQMLVNLCGDSAEKWQEAQTVAEACLQARLGLWDGVVRQIACAKGPERRLAHPHENRKSRKH